MTKSIKSAGAPAGSIRFTEQGRTTLCFIIAVLNWITAFLSLSMVVLGLYIKFSVQRFTNLVKDYDGNTLAYQLFGVGLILAIGNCLGGVIAFASANPDKRLKLRYAYFAYIIVTLVMSAIVLAGGVQCFLHISHLKKSFHGGIAAALTKYRDDIEVKKIVNLLQSEYSCCGNENYEDWFEVSWIHSDYLNFESAEDMEAIEKAGGYISDDAPFSCCSPAERRPCIHHNVQDNSAHVNYDFREHVTLHTTGCRDALMHYFGDRLLTYGGFVITSVFVLQVLLVLVTRFLQTSLASAALSEDPTAPSYGYLIKCGGANPEAQVVDKEAIQLLNGEVPEMPTPTPSHVSQRQLSHAESGQRNAHLQRRMSSVSRQGTQADLRRHSVVNEQDSAENTERRSSMQVRAADDDYPNVSASPPRFAAPPPPASSLPPVQEFPDQDAIQLFNGEFPEMPTPTPSHMNQRHLSHTESGQSNAHLQRRMSSVSRQGTQADLRRHSVNEQGSAVNTERHSTMRVRDASDDYPDFSASPPRFAAPPPPAPPLPRVEEFPDRDVLQPLNGESPEMPSHVSQRQLSNKESGQSNAHPQRRMSSVSRQGTQADLRRHSVMTGQGSAVNANRHSSMRVTDANDHE